MARDGDDVGRLEHAALPQDLLADFAEGEAVMVSWAAEDCIVLPGSRESMAGLVP